MSGKKETPRQKMIGMMYLVLMALLALNVSKDVLDAFVLVDEGLSKTTENFASKNEVYYREFDRAAAENEEKAGPWQAKALEVKQRSDELNNYIQELKLELVTATEGEDTEAIEEKNILGDEIVGKDNTFKPAEIMIGANNDGKANDLRQALDEFRDYLLSIVSEESGDVRHSVEASLDTSDPPHKEGETLNWQHQYFEHLPLIAVITLMSKMQSDVRNAESEVLEYLYSQIDAGAFKFNLLESVVISNSNHIIRGNEYAASVFMAAFDTTQEPIVYVGRYDSTILDDGTVDYSMIGEEGRDYEAIPIEGGRGIFKVNTSGAGTGWKPWGGIISLKRDDGTFTNKPFRAGYTVAMPSLVVSPTQMLVFYTAIDNPVEVSVPGYPANAISVSINNGRIRGSGTNYTVVPTREGKARVSVSVRENGRTRSMGYKDFRVAKLPDPSPTLAGVQGGTLSLNQILGEIGLKASMPEWFQFGGVNYTITGYTFTAIVQGFDKNISSTSANLSSDMRGTIRNLRSGSRIYFNDITAVGPDGSTRYLPTLSVKIR
jgi:gliding motility-associated protein GldM